MLTSSRTTNILLVVILAVGIALVAMVASGVRGGPLDPAGSPSSTMKTLEEIPGSWSRILPANDGALGPNPPAGCNSTRFQCVFGNAAVLDRETGLVWTRDASAIPASNLAANRFGCSILNAGGRLGWRLATIDELSSLYDPIAVGLPTGHPFVNLQTALNGEYWSSTQQTGIFFLAFFFGNGGATTVDRSTSLPGWCVRGVGGQVTAAP